jgi:hypothetical protein
MTAAYRMREVPAGETISAIQTWGARSMADSHGNVGDPNAAPMHGDIKESFSQVDVVICVALGLIAIAAGTICGIIFVNN